MHNFAPVASEPLSCILSTWARHKKISIATIRSVSNVKEEDRIITITKADSERGFADGILLNLIILIIEK